MGPKIRENRLFKLGPILDVKSSGEHDRTIGKTIRGREGTENAFFVTPIFFLPSNPMYFQKATSKEWPVSRKKFFEKKMHVSTLRLCKKKSANHFFFLLAPVMPPSPLYEMQLRS